MAEQRDGVRTGPGSSKSLQYATEISSPDELANAPAGNTLVTTNHRSSSPRPVPVVAKGTFAASDAANSLISCTTGTRLAWRCS